MKLKICGMKYPHNTEAVAQLQPDFMGFIFYKKSPRLLIEAIPKISKSIYKVGVFVDADIDFIIDKVNQQKLDMIQLHGNESPQFCAQLKSKCQLEKEFWKQTINEAIKEKQDINPYRNIKIIKAFCVDNTFNFNALNPFEKLVDYFLFDTKGRLPGGNGSVFDWDILLNYKLTKPYFLSGGIGLKQVKQLKQFKKTAISKYCFALDVNSKFEIEPGRKNIEKLKKFKSLI
jgi:phosphoribosylanthranilate isomerase